MKNRLLTMTLVAVMILSVFASAGVAAQEDDSDLAVAVDDGDDIVVTVTANDTAVANATVDVTTTENNTSYAGAGEYTTDDDGTVELPTLRRTSRSRSPPRLRTIPPRRR